MTKQDKKILDEILYYISKWDFPEWHNLAQIQKSVLPEEELSYGDIRKSLETMKMDGYVEVIEMNNDLLLRARRTNKGINFSKMGGYSNVSLDMTKDEKEVLIHLSKVRGVNNTDQVISDATGIPKSDVIIATESLKNRDFIYDTDTTENQKNMGEKSWKIWPDGEKKVARITDEKVQKKVNVANLIAGLALLVSFGALWISFQGQSYQNQQNILLDEQNNILKEELQQQIKEDSISHLYTAPDTIYIPFLTKDTTTKGK